VNLTVVWLPRANTEFILSRIANLTVNKLPTAPKCMNNPRLSFLNKTIWKSLTASANQLAAQDRPSQKEQPNPTLRYKEDISNANTAMHSRILDNMAQASSSS
jgi:hypothetical protein